MYEATAVDHSSAGDAGPKDHVYCRFMVEMQNLANFQQHLSEIGAVDVRPPEDKDLEEYKEWGDPELCVCYWAFVPNAQMPTVEGKAEAFVDRR